MKSFEPLLRLGVIATLTLLVALAFPLTLFTAIAQEEDSEHDSRSEMEEEYVEDEEAEYYQEDDEEYYEEDESKGPPEVYYYEEEQTPPRIETTPFDDTVTLSEQETITINVLANDRAILGRHNSLRILETTAPSFGEITVNSDNTITYNPSQIALPSGYEKADVVQYTASADGLSSYTGMITMWIQQVNDPPVAYSANYTIKEGVKSTFYLDAHDEDNDSLTFILISDTEFGETELDPSSGRLAYTPLFEFSGKETVTFKVSDGVSESDVESIEITVEEVGNESMIDVPDDDDPEEISEDNSTSGNLQLVADAGDDSDVLTADIVVLDGTGSYDANGDPLTYSWSQVSGPEVSLVDHETAHPAFDAPSVETKVALGFELTVSDGNVTDTDVVTITVVPITSDLMPHVYPNIIELSEPDLEVPLAIFGSAALEAEEINFDSLRLGPGSAAATRYELDDSDNDGIIDHISYYRTVDLGLNEDDKTACLSGSVESHTGQTVEFEICKAVKVKS
jgi:hypothetical protein